MHKLRGSTRSVETAPQFHLFPLPFHVVETCFSHKRKTKLHLSSLSNGEHSVNAAHDLRFMLTSKNISIGDRDTVTKAWQVLRCACICCRHWQAPASSDPGGSLTLLNVVCWIISLVGCYDVLLQIPQEGSHIAKADCWYRSLLNMSYKVTHNRKLL